MKKVILNILLLFIFININCSKDHYLKKYNKLNESFDVKKKESNEKEKFFNKNFLNIKNSFPFYIIRLQVPLFLKNPENNFTLPDNFIILKYGDIVFPVKDKKLNKDYFYVKTLDNKYGWIYSGSGISIDYQEDESLYFFDDKHYLKKYIDLKGKIDNSSLIVLAKNIVPFLLDNYDTEGWFYPSDYKLAFDISQLAVKLAEDKKTHFESAAILFDWTVSEYLVANNLLADSYHKLGYLEKAEEIHKDLIKRHFWKNYDNSRVGGLNSVVKLEMIYIDMMKKAPRDSADYIAAQNKLIDSILVIGDTYNKDTIIDKKWHLTGAEWVLDILRTSFKSDEFFDTAKKLTDKTLSDGYKDMIALYIAIVNYNNGQQDEAMEIFSNLKSKNSLTSRLKVKDWLSENRIVPDSLIYQYDF